VWKTAANCAPRSPAPERSKERLCGQPSSTTRIRIGWRCRRADLRGFFRCSVEDAFILASLASCMIADPRLAGAVRALPPFLFFPSTLHFSLPHFLFSARFNPRLATPSLPQASAPNGVHSSNLCLFFSRTSEQAATLTDRILVSPRVSWSLWDPSYFATPIGRASLTPHISCRHVARAHRHFCRLPFRLYHPPFGSRLLFILSQSHAVFSHPFPLGPRTLTLSASWFPGPHTRALPCFVYRFFPRPLYFSPHSASVRQRPSSRAHLRGLAVLPRCSQQPHPPRYSNLVSHSAS